MLTAHSALKGAVSFADEGEVNSLDMYISKEGVESLGKFVHQILVAIGASQSLNNVMYLAATKSKANICSKN